MQEITGRTRIFGILADPVGHVKTPQRINALALARGCDAVMVPLHVTARNLATAVAGLRTMENLDGFIVTVPHKTAIVPLLDELSAAARCVGAVNAVRREPDGRLRGEILDGTGFVAGLRAAGHEPRGRSVYLAGAGGAASAIAFALAEAGAAQLTVANRTRESGPRPCWRACVRLFPGLPFSVGTDDPSGHDIVVNATSQGLREDDAFPLDVALLQPHQLVAEIIMQPAVTPLLSIAAGVGCQTHPGLPMLDCQLELMADWMGVRRENER